MPILSNIKLIKIDSDTREVIKADFTFGLFADSDCTELIQEVKSDKDAGTILFKDIRYGKWFIKELSQPNNYQLSDKVVELVIDDKGIFIDGTKIDEENGIYSFEFENTQIPRIQTGNEMNYILLISIAIVSILIIVAGIVILKKHSTSLK